MSNSKLVYSVFVFVCFASSTVSSSYLNTSLTAHKYKCPPQQSLALLLFKQSLPSINYSIDLFPLGYSACQHWLGSAGYHHIMMNWNTSADCCDWEGVSCDRSTGNVIGVDLSCGKLKGTIHPNTSLFNLPYLQKLNLAYNDFSDSQIPREIGRFSRSLTHFNISYCGFSGHVPFGISLLPKLVSLDLSFNYDNLRIELNIFKSLLNNYTLLRDLRLSYVNISWVLPIEHINISSSLTYLDLSNCNLMGSLPKYPLNLTHLTYLDLSENKLNGTLPSWLFTLPSLQYLLLSNNMFSGDVPFNSSALPPLEALSLGYNQLGGQIDEALILKFTNLTWLHLSYNNFSSEWELDTLLSSLTNLYALELSYSGLSLTTTGNVTHNASPNFQMLSLASCKIKEFPESLRSMRYLEWLDLSNNEIHGDIPIWAGEIGGDSRLLHLHLQSNQIKGPSLSSICNMSNLYWLDLSNNNFGGVIPQCFGNITSSLSILNLNSNQFQGPVRSSICNRSNFYSLDLSNNSFDGVIPQCFGNLSSPLFMMDLGNNDFHGTIPDMFDDCKNLQGLILNGNQLHGELPASLSRCHFLKVLDLENNHLNGTFPNWLGNLSKLQVLNLKSNMFYGDIATSSIVDSPFPSLRVLDLSHNRFVGQLPAIYFENFSAMKNVVRSSTIPKYLNIMGIKDYSIDISVKGMVQDFPQIFVEYTIVCLSNNSFEGKIPDIIGSLNSLKVLDLSHNSLTGLIPQDLGKLSEIESLDLSWNQLTGEIPQSLAELTGLGFLNLSQNHLMGRIPAGTQFTTFGNSFRGNLNLCGLPLPKKCNENQQESHLDDDGDEEENGFTWKVVMLGYGCGTLFGLVMGYLMLSTGRPKWFNAIADEAERMILTRRKKRRYITYIGR